MAGMIIKRGVYTRVGANNIESNEGTFFEAIMAPTYDTEMTATDASATATVSVAQSHFTIIDAFLLKLGAGGVGDTLTLNRVRAGVTAPLGTFDVATAAAGARLAFNGDFDGSVSAIQPGDSLTLVGVKAAGSPAGVLHIACRID
jgi:hypothetical protein